MAKKINTLSAGNKVKLNENGVPKQFIFLQSNHYGQSEVTLIRKDSFATKAFKGGSNSNNGYNGSDIDFWANTEYLLTLDPIIQACLINVPLPTARGSFTSGSTVDSTVVNLYRKGFLLSAREATNFENSPTEGTNFAYFATEANRIAYYEGTSTAVKWWVRSPDSDGSGGFCVIPDGRLGSVSYVSSANEVCPRPALALSSEIYVSDSVDGNGCYTIVSAPAGEEYMKIDGIWMKMV